ncbi:inositol 2-dehydrogenase [Pseudoxanthomonas wuyuanensis]|uniref:Myo-inositol 2-dehydrogenase n=1 Tax=Pseudoxanthomonas wuyuanensis TaxID=1073196 RepID=A0A286D6K7_9GAMM|nr:inositol 2-dehydrogenase [Pseudoxanthomonas wuyuanensis]KAF1721450.1 inositol 2-dehydrogenase [Pseudoxanthomonas wuyuanensis]SOD54293.1 myo-inositol 2-dehydrogenase [Pseudoxanthomonas wuyuanensis]
MHKVALIGAGRIGRIHARNAALHPRIELAGVVDAVEASARTLAQEWQVPVLSLEQALGDDTIAGIIIASSTDTHLDYSLRAAAAGKAVFCEKPIDQDLARARAAAGQLAGARLLLAFNRRFDPNFQALKARLDSGAIGVLESLQITSNDPGPPPPAYIAISGGLFKDMAIHDFDMARWLLGEEPEQVYAVGSCLVDAEIGKLGDIDTARTVLKTASGRICVIANSRRSGFGYDQRIEAYASAGMVRADNVTESTVQVWSEAGATADRFQNFFLDRYAEAYRREMDHFADMLEGAAASVGYADGVAALALAEAAAESVLSGQPVRL